MTSIVLPLDLARSVQNPEFSRTANLLLKGYLSGEIPMPVAGGGLRERFYGAKTAAETEVANAARLAEIVKLGAELLEKMHKIREEYTYTPSESLRMTARLNEVNDQLTALGFSVGELLAKGKKPIDSSWDRYCDRCNTKMLRANDGLNTAYCPICRPVR